MKSLEVIDLKEIPINRLAFNVEYIFFDPDALQVINCSIINIISDTLVNVAINGHTSTIDMRHYKYAVSRAGLKDSIKEYISFMTLIKMFQRL